MCHGSSFSLFLLYNIYIYIQLGPKLGNAGPPPPPPPPPPKSSFGPTPKFFPWMVIQKTSPERAMPSQGLGHAPPENFAEFDPILEAFSAF